MSSVLTQKQEAFCRAVLTEENNSAAYRKAYNWRKMKDTTINRNAKQLMDNSKIATRVAELQAAHTERHNITVDGLTEDAVRIMHSAEDAGQFGPARGAVELIAKLHGKLVDLSKIQLAVANVDDADRILQDAGMLPR